MKPFSASNAQILQSETRGVGHLGDQSILQQGYAGVDTNVWLKTGTGPFALPNTAANLRDPYKKANFLIS